MHALNITHPGALLHPEVLPEAVAGDLARCSALPRRSKKGMAEDERSLSQATSQGQWRILCPHMCSDCSTCMYTDSDTRGMSAYFPLRPQECCGRARAARRNAASVKLH